MIVRYQHLVGVTILLLGGLLSLAACSRSSIPVSPPPAHTPPAPTPLAAATLPNLGPAPDFNNKVWLNTEEPLTLAGLRGRVVLLEFWTFG